MSLTPRSAPMSQPPYPPPDGTGPGGEQPGQGWNRPGGPNEPTEQFGTLGEGQREQTRQFGPPPYGQPGRPAQPGQPPYGQPPYGGPPYGQPPYGQPPYGQPPYGQPPYGQPPYGQPPYGQAPYGQPWAPPGGQPPRGHKNTLIALIVAGIVVLAAIGVALALLLNNNDSTDTASATATATPGTTSSPSAGGASPQTPSTGSPGGNGIPPAGMTPDGLGDDPTLNQYARSCYDGDMQACDERYDQSEIGSDYETYGGTCAGRQPATNSDTVYCTDAFPA